MQWEIQYGLNPLDPSDATLDGDKDTLINIDEFTNLTDPTNNDSDNDWIKDGFEVNFLGTNPLNGDTDGDGMPDFWEGINWLLWNDPANANYDTDGDGYTDLQEYQNGTNPRRIDRRPARKCGACRERRG